MRVLSNTLRVSQFREFRNFILERLKNMDKEKLFKILTDDDLFFCEEALRFYTNNIDHEVLKKLSKKTLDKFSYEK